jgi:hypothetical protein
MTKVFFEPFAGKNRFGLRTRPNNFAEPAFAYFSFDRLLMHHALVHSFSRAAAFACHKMPLRSQPKLCAMARSGNLKKISTVLN